MMRSSIIWVLLSLSMSSTATAQYAADQYFDPNEMAAAREALWSGHGSQINSLVLGERLEHRSAGGNPMLVWEGQGWVGNDDHKLWIKTEGEYGTADSRFEDAELQALYSRAISPFWDIQLGLRHDFEPDPTRSYLTVGVQGLARYWFEIDAQLFLSDEGDLSARLEAEYELRLTQRLILQPRLEINSAFSDDTDRNLDAGLSSVDAGLRLRYEFRRTIAPYLGLSWNRVYGREADLLRSNNEDPGEISVLAGVRFWY